MPQSIMHPMKPYWPLERVKAIAAESGRLQVKRGRAANFFSSMGDALACARETILALSERNYAVTKHQADVCDVYGVKIEGDGWYLKLCIDESAPTVVVVSLHPLDHPIRTRGGLINP
jgi:hypothetical protein